MSHCDSSHVPSAQWAPFCVLFLELGAICSSQCWVTVFRMFFPSSMLCCFCLRHINLLNNGINPVKELCNNIHTWLGLHLPPDCAVVCALSLSCHHLGSRTAVRHVPWWQSSVSHSRDCVGKQGPEQAQGCSSPTEPRFQKFLLTADSPCLCCPLGMTLVSMREAQSSRCLDCLILLPDPHLQPRLHFAFQALRSVEKFLLQAMPDGDTHLCGPLLLGHWQMERLLAQSQPHFIKNIHQRQLDPALPTARSSVGTNQRMLQDGWPFVCVNEEQLKIMNGDSWLRRGHLHSTCGVR